VCVFVVCFVCCVCVVCVLLSVCYVCVCASHAWGLRAKRERDRECVRTVGSRLLRGQSRDLYGVTLRRGREFYQGSDLAQWNRARRVRVAVALRIKAKAPVSKVEA
jgi:hypothetical protein